MIPVEIVEFLNGPLSGAGGSQRGAVPAVHLLCGWSVDGERRRVTCLVAPGYGNPLEPGNGGPFAFTATAAGTAQTYQLKGSKTEVREASAEDQRVHERYLATLLPAMDELGYPREMLEAFFAPPTTAVSFEVEEIFDQTPGPGAGRRIVPPEGGS